MSFSNLVSALSGDSTKTIAVLGATGNQGGSVVKAFHALCDDNYEIRAITRDPESEKAKALAPFVNEVVKANGDDEDSMVKAFEGCYGAFVVTNWWEDMDTVHEMKTLRTIKAAAKKAGVKHVVLSSIEDTRSYVDKLENKDTWEVLHEGGMYVPHFDGKGEIGVEYLAELPSTLVNIPFYMENFINFGMGPSRQAETDPYAITFPMGSAKMSMVAVEDIGKCICAVLQDKSYIGKSVGVQSDVMTCEDIAATFAKVCGQPVNYNAVPADVYASFGFPGAKELAIMFRFYEECAEDVIANRTPSDELLEKMGSVVTLEDFITANKGSFVLEPMSEKESEDEEKPAIIAPQQDVCCTIL